MSHLLISRSWDLQKLRNEGYELEIKSGFLLVKGIPYVNSRKEVKRGTLVVKLVLAGDKTTRPDDHVAYLAGEYPCNADGTEIGQIRHISSERTLAEGVVIQHSFSAKPKPDDFYPDYHAKIATYAAILAGPAQLIDPNAGLRPSRPSSPRRRPGKLHSTTSIPPRAGRRSMLSRRS